MHAHLSAIAKRYSQALDECIDTDALAKRIQDNVEKLLAALVPEIEQFFARDTVPQELKRSVAEELAQKLGVDDLVLRTLMLMSGRNRLGAIRLFLLDLRGRLDRRLGIRRIQYVSAAELSREDLKSIEQSLSEALGSQIVLSVSVEPSLLAGCILRLGNLVADLSLRTRMMQLKESLSEGA